MEKTFDLNERLTNFGATIISFSEKLPQTFAGRHLAGQIIRSGTAPALHYGEAQAGESKKGFSSQNENCLKRTQGNFKRPEHDQEDKLD